MLFVLNHPTNIPLRDIKTGLLKGVSIFYDKWKKSDFWCLLILLAAFTAAFTTFIKKYTSGITGESVTKQLRINLLMKILG